MKYIRTDTGQEISRRAFLRGLHPNISWPNPLPGDLSEYGIAAATVDARPSFDPMTHTATLADVATKEGGAWAFRWTVTERSQADKDARRAAWEAQQLGAIKDEAGGRIEAIVPPWRQRNMIALAVDLADKRLEGGTLTGPEQAQMSSMRGVWNKVKAIRAASDTLEALVPAADPATFEIEAWDGWPSFA